MNIFINTDLPYHDSLIRSHLSQRGVRIFTGFDAILNLQVHGLYLSEDSHLLNDIRRGETSITPFASITVVSASPSFFLQGKIGVSAILEQSFTLSCIDQAFDKMTAPSADFIHIDNIYMGPERRIQKQRRPIDRRTGFHVLEKRYRAIKGDNDSLDWLQTASGLELQQTLMNFRQKLAEASNNRAKLVRDLVATLKQWNYTSEEISELVGVRV